MTCGSTREGEYSESLIKIKCRSLCEPRPVVLEKLVQGCSAGLGVFSHCHHLNLRKFSLYLHEARLSGFTFSPEDVRVRASVSTGSSASLVTTSLGLDTSRSRETSWGPRTGLMGTRVTPTPRAPSSTGPNSGQLGTSAAILAPGRI